MAKYSTLTSLFTAIANSLRTKTGSTGKIVADDFPSVIDGISLGITPTGTKQITTNGTHNVTEYVNAEVNVPVGTTPTGTKDITTNGTHDVANYANANVNVPIPSGYIKPSGTKSITTNGTHDVTSYASATVNVPVGITPTGTKEITANGTHDVTNFASANVNVPVKSKVLTIDIASDLGNGTNTTKALLSADSFIKEHYADDGFSILMYPVTPLAGETNVVHSVLHSNHNIGASNVTRTGVALYSSSATAISFMVATAKLNGTGYNVSLRVTSAGNLNIYVASSRIVKAGTYVIVMTCAT